MKNKNQKGIFPPRRDPARGGTTLLVGIIIIVAAAIIIFGGVFAYQYFAIKSQSIVQTDQTAGWKTYKNDEYGFEFKYPQNYYFRAALPAAKLFFLEKEVNGEKVNWFEINITLITKYGGPITNELLARCAADGPIASISCDKVVKQSQFINDNSVKVEEIYLNEVIIIHNAAQKTEKTKGPIFVVEMLKREENVIYFQNVGRTDKEESDTLLRQILSTFKFTE